MAVLLNSFLQDRQTSRISSGHLSVAESLALQGSRRFRPDCGIGRRRHRYLASDQGPCCSSDGSLCPEQLPDCSSQHRNELCAQHPLRRSLGLAQKARPGLAHCCSPSTTSFAVSDTFGRITCTESQPHMHRSTMPGPADVFPALEWCARLSVSISDSCCQAFKSYFFVSIVSTRRCS